MKVRHRILFMISIALLAAFCYSAISRLLFLGRAERDVGVVIGLWAENGRCGTTKRRRRCTNFFATVEFQSAGSRQSGRLDAGYARKYDQPLSKALYRLGDRVPVVFDPNRLEEIYRDKLWDIWGPSLVLLLFQIFTLGASFRDPEMSELVTLKLNEGS